MRIGIDYRPVTAAPYSGIARQVLAIEEALRHRPDVEVLRFTAAPQEHPHRSLAYCPPWASPVNGLHRPQERIKFELQFLPRILRETLPDAYIATANSGLPVWRTPQNIAQVLLMHDVFQLTMDNHHSHWIKALLYRGIDRFAISHSVARADQIWMPSEYTRKQAATLFPGQASRMYVLPNAVPQVQLQPDTALPVQLEAPFWLLVGTREPRKNVPWFVEHWNKARSRFPGKVPALVLVGNAADLPEPLRSFSGLYFVSGISDMQLLALYARAAMLWQPSRAEGFGLPVVEAMGQGTPVAVARGSALDEIAPPDAVRFDPDDGAAVQELMCQLSPLQVGQHADAMTLREWAARYAMPAYGQRLWQLLDGVLNKGRR